MAKKRKKEEAVRNCVYLTYDERRYGGEIREGQENDPWPDHEDETIEWNLVGAFKNRVQDRWIQEEVNIDFDARPGEKVWVVYVRYGTGCTFGHINGAWTILGVYEHQGQAEKVKASVYDGSYQGYKCWEGYFESFESCEVEGLTLQGNALWDVVKL